MCGILFSLQDRVVPQTPTYAKTWTTLQELNSRRGPSAQDLYTTGVTQQPNSTVLLNFYGAVLHLRGDQVCHQPHIARSGSVLLWNGEIFDGIPVGQHENDGQVLMVHLEAISAQEPAFHPKSFLDIMEKVEGPYAFLYYHAPSKRIFFGRDCLGRRSLLWHRNLTKGKASDAPFILTSVGYSTFRSDLLPLDEVPADGIYCMSLDADRTLTHYPWISADSVHKLAPGTSLHMRLPFGRVNAIVPTNDQLPAKFAVDAKFDQAHPELVPDRTDDMKQAIALLKETLGDSVRRRVQDIPRTGLRHDARVGILFSGGLDCLCLAALADKFLPPGEAIDLLNVGFENPRSEKAKAAEEALALRRLKKLQLKNADQGTARGLATSVDGAKNQGDNSAKKFNVPDRVTGYESLKELQRIAPLRQWNFVEVNVPFEEATAQRSEILERIAPLETVMDLSIAMAFWFASRGIGQIKSEDEKMAPYTSQARVLLSGLGADEQLGGYSRHKDQFDENGWEGLIHELQLDLDRISTRNLGRDDRIISDHGKEARYPFLGAHVVSLLSSLRVDLKVDLRYPRGVGEKILLRHLARDLGFVRSSSHWKRAVQFGARTAKMTESGRGEIAPNKRKFTKHHEWIEVSNDGVTTFGFTEFGQSKFGDILRVEFKALNKDVKQGGSIGFLENIKSAPDIKAPISGKILRLNEQLTMTPSLLNTASETEGWIAQIQNHPSKAKQEMKLFIEEDEYKKLCEKEEENLRMALDKPPKNS
ncbi:hypothetical protein BG004_002096 [Podila humilis]|nr:hypothetical protein BG004_002096 [Podila humilis]